MTTPTREEYKAKAMLLGMHWAGSCLVGDDKIIPLFKKRVSDGRFPGTALWDYFHADTLEPIAELQSRSELDIMND